MIVSTPFASAVDEDRKYRLWSALSGNFSPFALSAGNSDMIVSTPFASPADEDSNCDQDQVPT